MGRRRADPNCDLPSNVQRKGDVYYFVCTNLGVRIWIWMTTDRAEVERIATMLRERFHTRRGNLRGELHRRDGFQCRYCGATESLEVDHVIPLSMGGANTLQNLVVACRSCNASKGNSRVDEFVNKPSPAAPPVRKVLSRRLQRLAWHKGEVVEDPLK